MIFKSRKDNLFKGVMIVVILLLCLILFFSIFDEVKTTNHIVSIVVNALVLCLLLWVFYGTSYKLTSTALSYKSGPFKGEIAITDIHQIIKGKTLWVGLKPATASKGLIIKYNKFDEVYISPKTNDSFITEILKHNSTIKIIEA
ncbi:PH domain-containing protein [Cellulophaga lytica]|uniref:PH domain-containing protein n=1 Tax=Cellulophaga lytica TaxID=979 RepID=UPI0026E47315|nr:PH domain-containing protein [Cellulophaga lytica]MDO6854037.1 PH domain-containing protein [Cellulophaga lytica]